MIDDLRIKLAAEIAVRGTKCSYSIAREIAEKATTFAKADGIAFDAGMLADVTRDMLEMEGWL
jgi:hypothetical protein